MKKRVVCLVLGIMMIVSQVSVTGAVTRKEQLQQEKAATQSKLSAQQSTIDSLEEQKQALTAEINQLDSDLVDVLVQIDILTGELNSKSEEIEATKVELAEAEKDRDEQYEAMKKRIQYLYENGGDNAWAQMLLQAEDLSSLLNQAEYVQQLYESDRESLENFKAAVQQVTDLESQLESEKAELEEMQLAYQDQEATLQTTIEQKRATSDDCEAQIAVAESQAAKYASLIREQNEEIRQIEIAEQKAAEEAAAKAAAEQAAKEAAAKEAAQKESSTTGTTNKSNSNTTTSGSTNNKTSNNNNSSSKPSNSTSDNKGGSTSKGDSSTGSGSSSGGSVAYNPKGSSVASYACNFVGNPYVYGGTSLTNGADCSGFVMSVYAHFGVSLPHSSGALAGVGKGVSYAEAMPGDIICYSGHVAIYLGGGAIVHASNETDGIKISPNAAYRTIVAVRRVL